MKRRQVMTEIRIRKLFGRFNYHFSIGDEANRRITILSCLLYTSPSPRDA